MILAGKRGAVFGVRTKRSLAWAIAEACGEQGAQLAIGYRGEREQGAAEALGEQLGRGLPVACDVTDPAQVEAAFERIRDEFGALDFLVHSIAHAGEGSLEAGLLGVLPEAFGETNEVSARSLIALARAAVPLMPDGGSIMALTFLGAQRVVQAYGVMGVAKAALEATIKYLAAELGPCGIRVNGISPGAIMTPAARAIPQFTDMLRHVAQHAPLRRNVRAAEVGTVAAFLASDLASAITGEIIFADCGFHVLGIGAGLPSQEE
jgi:enoyl-[acyl-carrier protein] reductase I